MAQHDYIISDQSGLSFLSDLNSGLSAIVTNNSGATEPATTYPYMRWTDTTSGILKYRNAADDGWISKFTLDGTALEAANNLGDVASAATAFANIKQLATESVSGVADYRTMHRKNLLINGNCGINQREVTGTVVLGAGVYGHDRFKAGASGCTYTFSMSANVTTITISAGSLIQVVEGLNLFSGTYALSWTGTAQGKIGAGSYSASGVTGSIVGGTDTSIEFNTGTLSLVQLEKGSVATDFEYRHINEELFLCRRYFIYVSTRFTGIATTTSDSSGRYTIPFPTKMRAVPTVVVGANATLPLDGLVAVFGGTTYTATAANITAEGIGTISRSAGTAATTVQAILGYTADAEL